MTHRYTLGHSLQSLRVLVLLAAADRAGLGPVGQPQLHALAYLVNALAPVWKLDPQDEQLLKLRRGPYYPAVQKSVDRLVGCGLVRVDRTTFAPGVDGVSRFAGWFAINGALASEPIDRILQFEEDRRAHDLALEVCLSASAGSQEELAAFIFRDASLSDESIQDLQSVSVFEHGRPGRSASIAGQLVQLLPSAIRPSPAASVQLYVKFLQESWDRIA